VGTIIIGYDFDSAFKLKSL